jgi:hypothetical protein
MNAANLVINVNANRDLETRLAAQGVLTSTRVSCNDLQAVAAMGMDAQVDQLVVEFEQQLKQDSDIIEVNLTATDIASQAINGTYLKAARIVASSAKQQSLLVSLELEAAALNIPQHKLHHVLLSAQAQGADFVTVSQVADISVAKRLVIAGQTVDVPVVISLNQQALKAQGQCSLSLSQTLYQAGAAAVGIDGYIGPQNTDTSDAHSWLSDKRGSLYIH